MSTRILWPACLLAVAAFSLAPAAARACPFCAATSQTLSEEMAAADAVVLAKLVASPKPDENAAGPGDPAAGQSTFQVVQVLKGGEHIKAEAEVKALHFGETEPGATFLLTGQLLPELGWGTPIPLSDAAVEYVAQLPTLPKKGVARLVFFQEYFEHPDSILAQDAYDEFARAPYSEVVELKGQMHHDKLIEWVQNVEISPSHRRLYLTMLSVCGNEDDLPMLATMMKSDDRRVKAGLDALIACYLTLKGPEGMPLVEDLFLKNKDAEYADTYAAIMALRFHGQETDVIPKERLLEGLRHMLDRPMLADLVIADLARWKDWSVMDRLIELFKNADDESSWVRSPVVTYLQAAARQKNEIGEKAKAAIAELEKIDPEAVKQARAFAAFGGLPAKKVEPRADAPAETTPDSKQLGQLAANAEKADLEKPSLPAEAPPVTPVVATGESVAATGADFAGPSVASLLAVGLVVLVVLRMAYRGAGY